MTSIVLNTHPLPKPRALSVINPRQQVSVLLSDAVEALIIDAKTPRSIFLPSHDYWSRPWGIRLVDNSVLQHEVDVLLHFDFLSQ